MVRYKTIILALALVSIVLIAGCTKTEEDENGDEDDEVVCNDPYILVGTECCLDSNSNNVCDTDETTDDTGDGNGNGGTSAGTECVTADDCDDDQECTTDACNNGYCYNTLEAGCLYIEKHSLEITHKQSYVDDNNFHVVGLVKNVGDSTQENGKITVNLYDTNGKKISEHYGYTSITKIKKTENSPFDVNVGTLPNDYFNYLATIASSNASEEPYEKMVVNIDNLKNEQRLYELQGNVKNSGSQTAKNVEVVVAFYDRNNKVIRVKTDSIDGTVDPGETRSFYVKLEGSAVNMYTDDILVQAEVA